MDTTPAMTTYRHLPTELKGWELPVFTGAPLGRRVLPAWVRLAVLNGVLWSVGNEYVIAHHRHGQLKAHPGDMLLEDPEGHLYPCSKEVFPKIYEKA